MNFVFLSPHFPPNYYKFAVALKNQGVTVLGLADENYDSLRPELKAALTEYYREPACARISIFPGFEQIKLTGSSASPA